MLSLNSGGSGSSSPWRTSLSYSGWSFQMSFMVADCKMQRLQNQFMWTCEQTPQIYSHIFSSWNCHWPSGLGGKPGDLATPSLLCTLRGLWVGLRRRNPYFEHRLVSWATVGLEFCEMFGFCKGSGDWHMYSSLFLIEVQLIYNAMLDSGVQQSNSVIQSDSHTHIYVCTIYIFFFRFFSLIYYYKKLNIVACAIQ